MATSLLCDRDPVRIAGQIGQHRLGPGERALGIDDPLALAKRCEPVGEDPCVGKRSVFAKELQPARAMHVRELFEEAPPEQP